MSMTDSLANDVGIKPACDALAVSRASYYRWQNQCDDLEKTHIRPLSPLALSPYEQQQVLDTLHDERFADKESATGGLRCPSGWRQLSLFREDDVPNSGSA
jgi:putative transposase